MTTTEITQAFLRELGAQNADGLQALFAAEIDWNVPGDPALTPWAGPRTRRDEVADYFHSLWGALQPGKSVVSVDSLVIEGDEAVVFAVFDHVAAPTGRPFHTDVALRLTVAHGEITRMHLFEDTAATADAYRV